MKRLININWNNIRHINMTRIPGYFLSRLSSVGKKSDKNQHLRAKYFKMSLKMSFGDIVLALRGKIQNLQKVVSFYHIRLFILLVLILTDLLRTEGCPGRSNQEAECFHFKVKSVKT